MKFKFSTPALFYFFFFICIHTGNAQDSLLNIYKFRTPGFKALQFNLDLYGGFTELKRINSPGGSSSSFSTNPSVNFFRIVSTSKRQYLSNMYLNPRLNFSRSENNNIKQTSSYSGVDFKWDFINRTFYKQHFFFEIGNTLELNNNINRNTSNITKFRANGNEVVNQLIIGTGKGRLENVQDAQMALFIINDLRRMGLLNNEPDAATQYQLAALITDINNQRVFDNRIRRIYELSRIDSFLQKNALVKQSSIAYFTTVNDNWALAFNPGRLSGRRIYAQVKPGVRYSFFKSEEASNNIVTTKQSLSRFDYFYNPEIGIEYQKPVSLQWQKTFRTSLGFQQEFRRSNQKIGVAPNEFETKNFQTALLVSLNSFYGFGYYPNNRTLINGGIQLNSFYDYSLKGSGKAKFFSIEPGLSFSANYFINFRTRAFANAGISWRYSELMNELPTAFVYDKTNFTGNINIGFTHIIF